MYNKMIAYKQLSQESIMILEILIKDLESKKLDAEQYLLQLIKQFNINVIYSKTNTFQNDDGVDYIIKNNNCLYITQLKFNLVNYINRKEIKRIYGDMLLSRAIYKLTNYDKYKIKYLILSPFINGVNKNDISFFRKNKLHLISGNDFIYFLNNPKYYIENKIQ